MKPTSLIMMATYNGEDFIKEQIESILQQTYQNWQLLIRDDGSHDNTISIIESYTERDNRIQLLRNNTAQHGAYINFWTLIREAKARGRFDYYFFADQDDIWPKERMDWMIKAAELNKDLPILVYGDMQVIDSKGKVIYESLNRTMGIGKMSGMTEFYSSGFIWGCNSLINRALFDITPVFPLDNSHVNIMSHDNYYAKFALIVGKIKFINKICILHRRYGNNTTGNYYLGLTISDIVNKATKGYSDVAKTHALGYAQTLETIKVLKQCGINDNRVVSIENAIQHGGITGVRTMLSQGIKRKQITRTIGIYVIMFLKSYKKYMKEIT